MKLEGDWTHTSLEWNETRSVGARPLWEYHDLEQTYVLSCVYWNPQKQKHLFFIHCFNLALIRVTELHPCDMAHRTYAITFQILCGASSA